MLQANERRVLAGLGGVFTFTVSNVKHFCLLENTEKLLMTPSCHDNLSLVFKIAD